jgi:hypothetical protein
VDKPPRPCCPRLQSMKLNSVAHSQAALGSHCRAILLLRRPPPTRQPAATHPPPSAAAAAAQQAAGSAATPPIQATMSSSAVGTRCLIGALLLISPARAIASGGAFLVVGADGRTGSLAYKALQTIVGADKVRASVYALDAEAKSRLGCNKCDASEGIYVSDVTQPKTLAEPMKGVTTVLCTVGAPGNATAKEQTAIEFTGVINQVRALAEANTGLESLAELRYVLCSSMGTTNPHPAPYEGGPVLFWKLNAEAFLGSTGITSVVVKPGGLVDGPAGNATLLTGHGDTLLTTVNPPIVSRADVAAVMVAAALHHDKSKGNLRFDLVSKPGPATDLKQLIQAAVWPWQK